MIVLQYPSATAQTEDWIDTMKNLSLAHKLELNDQLNTAQLTHSGAVYEGPKAITEYLDKLGAESEAWWYCTCDRDTVDG